MVVAVWSSRYETGIALIDDQHRSIFESLNHLAAAFRAGSPEAHVDAHLAKLTEYTLGHFQTEEAHMRQLGYPGLEDHLADHARLVAEARGLLAKHTAGHPMTMEVAIFLSNLITQHIDSFDMAMVRYTKTPPRVVTVTRE
jgi:hemerythrin